MSKEASGAKQWRTAIADPHTGDDINIRGYSVIDLMRNLDFVSTLYLVLTGRLPTEGQRRVIEMILVAVIDHGISPSSSVTRTLAASGVPIQACVAGGLMTIGDIQGGATEALARELSEAIAAQEPDRTVAELADRIVERKLASRARVDGFGHPQHPHGDPRAPELIAASKRLGVAGKHTELVLAMEMALETRKGRRIPLNVDGAMACTMLDAGLDWRTARALGMTSRSVGLAAHAIEEVVRERGWRGIPFDTVEYDGPDGLVVFDGTRPERKKIS